MKKIITAVMIITMVFSLAACGKKENPLTGYIDGDVTLGEYKGLTYTPVSTEVTDEEVEQKYQKEFVDLQQLSVEVTDRTVVENGDVVNIDYKGFCDGVEFEGGSEEGRELTIGSNSFIQGFEEGILGKSVGEEISIDVTFPEPYYLNPDLAGKPATFNVKINGIYQKVNLEITDALVAEKTDYDTIDAYKNSLRSQLVSSKLSQAESQRKNDIVEAAVKNTTFNKDLTEAIAKQKSELLASYDAMAQNTYQMDSKTVYQYMYGMDEAAYDQYVSTMAETNIKVMYMLSAICEKENISVTKEQREEETKSMLTEYGFESEAELYKNLESHYGITGDQYIEEQLKLVKAQEMIIASGVAAE